MLRVLLELSRTPSRRYSLTVAHLDHSIRENSRTDAAFVRRLARRLGLKARIRRVNVPGHAETMGMGLEQAARELRYEFLLQAAAQAGADFIATAHHADDNAETVMHRLVRGTHLRGLAGIAPSRALGRVTVVRPLLRQRRNDLLLFAQARRLKWRTDHTNFDSAISRNFIRHQLLPLARTINCRVEDALLRLAQAAGEAEDYIESRAADLLDRAIDDLSARRIALCAKTLSSSHALERTWAARLALERLGAGLGAVSAEHLRALGDLADGGKPVALPGRWSARRRGAHVVIELPSGGSPASYELALVPGSPALLPDGRTVLCEPMDAPARLPRTRAGVEHVDAASLRGRLICRPRREGERLAPLGCPGSQSVSDFLTNLKLPPERRAHVACVHDGGGIVYLAPLRIAERVKITPATRRVLRISVSPPWPNE